MQQQEIHECLLTYFSANNCKIVENHPAYLTVQLTIEMDKELMNRPFYWHYLEKTGGVPNPAKLTFITDPQNAPENVSGEKIHFGSPRLHQIMASAKRLSSFIRLYQKNSSTQNSLFPWLSINVKISYTCDRRREVFKSVGLNLISGEIREGFHAQVQKLDVTPRIPDYSYTLSPLIRPKSGLKRLDTYLRKSFETEEHSWAVAAIERWQNDLQLLEHFYKDMEEKTASYYTEKEALKAQYEPSITIDIINGGLFYLNDQAI
ncbi:YqhG family protein [Bacillus massiliglaciei]|uniref:YqhG family protein n=1 Tax=Bacillus massiliglaciei TaxID=1816693 RepID=UPI000AE2A9C3|nr:YqhG family protein [Bacillus massiliglaciei]